MESTRNVEFVIKMLPPLAMVRIWRIRNGVPALLPTTTVLWLPTVELITGADTVRLVIVNVFAGVVESMLIVRKRSMSPRGPLTALVM